MDKYLIKRKEPGEGESDASESEGTARSTLTLTTTIECPESETLTSKISSPADRSSSVSVSTVSPTPKRRKNADEQVNGNQLQSPSSNRLPSRLIERWKQANPWLQLKTEKVFCSICTEAWSKRLIHSYDSHTAYPKEAWVDNGFCKWKNATQRIQKHSTSTLHTSSAEVLENFDEDSVLHKLSHGTKKQMMDHRIALMKILSTLKVLGKQRLPIRGSGADQDSNFIQILKARAEDVTELKAWLKRNGHKWLHHDVQNEIIKLMASKVVSQNLEDIKITEFYSILLDETADLSRTEQVSDLVSSEYFMGFYATSSTKAEVLFQLVEDIFLSFDLPLNKLRGECYDGAANVSGKISGLQTRLREVEPRALFVHCNAHNLNLVVQDAIEKVPGARTFIGTVKDMINFVRDSPKRLATFQKIQLDAEADEDTIKNSALAAYCPTRWVMRISSLKRVQANYASLMIFFEAQRTDCDVDSVVSAKASGFLGIMQTFEFLFYLTMMTEIFDRIEILNKDLQNSQLSVIDSYRKVDAVLFSFEKSRDSKFQTIWAKSIDAVEELEIEEPTLPRRREIPKRLDTNAGNDHVFRTPEDMYRKKYYEVYDQACMSLKSRFDNESNYFFQCLEAFAIGVDKPEDVKKIIDFYQGDFDEGRLVEDRTLLLNLVGRKNEKIENLKDIVNFLQKEKWSLGILPEYVRFIKLLLTIPGSSCMNERCFSVLKRLKNYLRTTMSQNRLNDIAMLHMYSEKADELDDQHLLDEFLKKNSKRRNVFALSGK